MKRPELSVLITIALLLLVSSMPVVCGAGSLSLNSLSYQPPPDPETEGEVVEPDTSADISEETVVPNEIEIDTLSQDSQNETIDDQPMETTAEETDQDTLTQDMTPDESQLPADTSIAGETTSETEGGVTEESAAPVDSTVSEETATQEDTTAAELESGMEEMPVDSLESAPMMEETVTQEDTTAAELESGMEEMPADSLESAPMMEETATQEDTTKTETMEPPVEEPVKEPVITPPKKESKTDKKADKKKKKKSEEETDWLAQAILAADTLLDARGKIVFEGKIALFNLQELHEIRDDVMKSGTAAQKRKYVELEGRFIDVLRKVELAQLTQLTRDDWKQIELGFVDERKAHLTHIEVLTDSLVMAYAPMFKSRKGRRLLDDVDDKAKLIEDYYYRIGVLFIEYAEVKYQRETDAWDDLLDSIALLPDSLMEIAEQTIPPEPYVDYSLAIEKFEYLQKNYPKSEYADDAFYNFAYIKTESLDPELKEEGIELFVDFLDRYPESPYIPNVEMRLGEHYLKPNINDIDEAIRHFAKVIEYKDADEYDNALYRIGWCYYQKNDFSTAVRYLTETIDQTLIQMQRGRYSNLMEESIENLSKSFASDTLRGLGVGPAVSYLKEDPTRLSLFGARMLKRIGDIYQNDYGNLNEASSAYDTILTVFPNDIEAPDIEKKLIRCYLAMGDKDKVNEEKLKAFERYNDKSAWVAAQADSNAGRVKEATQLAEKSLREVIREDLIQASTTKQKQDYLETIDLCNKYVEYYPNTTETRRINYNLAVILTLELKDYEKAAVENLNYCFRYTDNENPEYKETCAANAIECARLMMEKQKEDSTYAIPKYTEMNLNIPPEIISAIPYLGDNPLKNSEILFFISIQNYISLYPQGEKTDVFMFNAAVLYFKHEKYAASRHYLELLINTFPQSGKFEDAKKHMMEGYFSEKDYANSERMAKEILGGPYSQELRDLAKKRVSESIYITAQNYAAAGEYIKAGSEYKRVAIEMPDFEFADNSLWESSNQFRQGAAWDSAIVSLELLVEKRPDSEWADKSLNNIAFIFQNDIKDKRKAAETFERLFDYYPKSDYAKNALMNASTNFSESESFTDALRVNEKYLVAFPDAENAVEIQYENATLYLKMGNMIKAIDSFEAFTRKFPEDPRNIRSAYEVGKYYMEQNDLNTAKTYFQNAVDSHRKMLAKEKEGFPRYASFALSNLLNWRKQEYLNIRYSPASAVNSNRAQKKSLKTGIEEGLKELITYRQKEALEAIYDLCRMDENLAKTEFAQAMPSLNEEEYALKRNAILDSSIILYITAAQSYYNGRTEIKTWGEALTKQRGEVEEKMRVMEVLRDSLGILPPDSQLVYDADRKMLDDIDASISKAAELQDSCTHKVAEIYLNNARSVTEVVDRVIAIPYPSNVKGRQEKMFYRENVLGGAVVPTAMNLIELYRQAYITADTVSASQAYKDSCHTEIIQTLDRVMKEYDSLIEIVLERYKINLGSFRQRIRDDDFSALDIFNAPLTYLDIGKVMIDSVQSAVTKFLIWAHTDPAKALPIAAIDSVYTGKNWYYYQVYSQIIKDNKDYYTRFDTKFGETGNDLYLDGMDLCETISGDVGDYRNLFMQKAVSNIELYALSNPTAGTLIRAAVDFDPFTYGHLLGLSLESLMVYSNTDWKVTADAEPGFEAPDYDDVAWDNAVLVYKNMKEETAGTDSLSEEPSAADAFDLMEEPLSKIVYTYTDSVSVAAVIKIPVDSMLVDTTLQITLDSMLVDTSLLIAGMQMVVDTSIFIPTDSIFVDTVMYYRGDSVWVDTVYYRATSTVPVDTVLMIPLQTSQIDTMLMIPVDSTLTDTMYYTSGDTVFIDTTLTIAGDSILVDTSLAIPVGGASFDSTLMVYLDSVFIDTTYMVAMDSFAVDTTYRIAVDSTAKDTMIFIFGDTTYVDTTFVIGGDSIAVDTTIYLAGEAATIDTVMYHYIAGREIDSTLYVPGDSTAIDTTLNIAMDSTLVDTFLFILAEDRVADTSIYVYDFREVDTTLYRILEWFAIDTTIIIPGESIAFDTTITIPGEEIAKDTVIYVMTEPVMIDTTLMIVSEGQVKDTTIYEVEYMERDTTFYTYLDFYMVDTSYYVMTDSMLIDTTIVAAAETMEVDTMIYIPTEPMTIDTTLMVITEGRVVDTTMYVYDYIEVDTTITTVLDWMETDTTLNIVLDSVRVDTSLFLPGESIAFDTSFYLVIDSMAVDTVMFVETESVLVDTSIYIATNWMPLDTAIFVVTDWLENDTTIYVHTDSMETEILDFSFLQSLGTDPIWAAEPAEKLYFRYKFNIDGKPIFGNLILSVDENYALFLNGEFVAEGTGEQQDWLEPFGTGVQNFLKPGENVVAVEATDADMTANGLWFTLEYNVMPENLQELDLQLETTTTEDEGAVPGDILPEDQNEMEQLSPEETPPDSLQIEGTETLPDSSGGSAIDSTQILPDEMMMPADSTQNEEENP